MNDKLTTLFTKEEVEQVQNALQNVYNVATSVLVSAGLRVYSAMQNKSTDKHSINPWDKFMQGYCNNE